MSDDDELTPEEPEDNCVSSVAWRVDFPEADVNFVKGIREWAGTNLRVSTDRIQLSATDERLFHYPLVYILEPGHMELSDEEAAALR